MVGGFTYADTLTHAGIVFQIGSGPDAWRVIAVPAKVVATSEPLTLLIALPMTDTENVMARFASIFFGFALLVVVAVAVLTRFLVTTTFSPLRDVERTAAAIADGDYSQRLTGSTNTKTEVGRLNRALNTMLGRIDRAFADRAKTIEQMRRFVGDASHELRTPLVTVRGYAELYRMGALQTPDDVAQAMERIEKEAVRMGLLVEDLLVLARLDETRPLDLAALDIMPLLRDAAMDTRAQAPDRVVTVVDPVHISAEVVVSADSDPVAAQHSAPTGPIAFAGATLARLRRRPPRKGSEAVGDMTSPLTIIDHTPIMVMGEENKIRQVLTNLIGNALRFTPPGSPLELRATADEPNGIALIEIVDHGEGIPEPIREKIFQRFWRADNSRTRETGGSGLGLAIVAGVVAAHGGTVEAVETPGGGATFQIRLPLLHLTPSPNLSTPDPRPSEATPAQS
jgi:two-component system OmpR family sensor kinase